MRTAILYLRVETEAEKSDLFKQSIDAVQFYADMPLMAVFVTQEISILPPLQRPEFSKLIEELRTGKRTTSYIIVPKWNTLSNNPKEALYWIKLFNKIGISVLCIESINDARRQKKQQS